MTPNLNSLPGARWRQTHQASVDAVLGAGVRSVTSRGSAFLNRDHWTARTFIDCLCKWAAANPRATPTSHDVEAWVHTANQRPWDLTEGVVIAQTPDDLPIATAMSLVGGAYHEAWHTKYSRRTPLALGEVLPNVMTLWSAVPNWGPLTGALLSWSNIVEDIRIERLGNVAYPGAKPRLEALQDLILRMEAEGRQTAEERGVVVNDTLSVVTGAFRDLGLGYMTVTQRTALKGYRERSPDAYALVESGDLRPLLDAAIGLTEADDLACIWLAMAVVAHIVKSAEKEQSQPQPQPQPSKPSKGPKPPPQPEAEEQEQGGDDDASDDEGDEDSEGGEDEGEDEGEDGDEGGDASDDGEDEGDSEDGDGEDGDGSEAEGDGDGEDNTRPTYKVGDRARLTAGPYAGREVEITVASEPDENGVQSLSFALVEQD